VRYRLTALCALAEASDVGAALAPLQLAVGVPGGSQVLAHALRAGIAEDPECATLKIDVRNAFNCVRRDSVLAAVAARAPALLPFVQWAYGAPSALHVIGAPAGTLPVSSQSGVRQGDPLGPLLFALALHETLESVPRQVPAVGVLAIADDAFLQGPPDALRGALDVFCEGAAVVGLEIARDKCALTGGGAAETGLALAADLGVAHSPDGIVAAGTPIGTHAFEAQHAASRADAACKLVDALRALPLRVQSQFLLLRLSLAPRLAHLLRTVEWERIAPSVRRLESEVHAAARSLLHMPPAVAGAFGAGDSACARAAAQIALPIRHGGFGLPVVGALEADAARLSAAALAQAAMAAAHPPFRPLDGRLRAGFVGAWERVHADAAPLWPAESRTLSPAFVHNVLPDVQRQYTRAVSDRDGAAFLARFDVATEPGQADAARMRSVACRPASAWIDALPTSPLLTLGDNDYVVSARFRLGLPQAAEGCPLPPCSCGEPRVSSDHAMICRNLRRLVTLRHDQLVMSWRRTLARAGLHSASEPHLGLARRVRAEDEDEERRVVESRGDFTTPMASGVVVGDVSVIHPAAPSFVRRAATTTGSAARARDGHKRASYALRNLGGGYELVPVSVESFGRLGGPAYALLCRVAAVAADGGRVSKAVFIDRALQELSVTLCKGNARVLRESLGRVAQASGVAYLRGLPVPVAEVVGLED
jgi:Reverse transcriptase (RNA-dependent DNA polymerase)